MTAGYFHRVSRETETRFWINNPTLAEIDQALAAGAIGCTTNPTYCARLLDAEPEYVGRVLDEVVRQVEDDAAAAEQVYQRVTARIADKFLPLYVESGGRHGFVTIQGDPRRDHDANYMTDEAIRHMGIGRNAMAKIPATQAGIETIGSLVARHVPICATEIFSVAQAIQVGEMYRKAAKRTGNHPPLYVTHITGIYERYLQQYVEREQIEIAPDVLEQAGWAVAHEEYRILKERGYAGLMLGGGAFRTQNFTDMVGGDMHVTINWSTARELIEADAPVLSRVHERPTDAVIHELAEKLPDFRRAFYPDALPTKEFAGFGPVVLFRDMFLDGYNRLLAAVATRRNVLASA